MPNQNPGLSKLFKKASSKHKSGNSQPAEALYKKILKTDKNHIDANYMLGALYAEQGILNKALDYTQRAEQLSPKSPFIKNNLGNIYRMTGKYVEAESCYMQALSLKPDLIECYNNLAILNRRQKNFTAAIELYQRALSLDPTFIPALYNLGKTLSLVDKAIDAKECFTEILKLNSDHPLSHNELGDFYMRHDDPKKAIYHFEKYLSLVKQDHCGVALKLAYMENGTLPAKQPAEVVRQTYEIKANTWDQDIQRANSEFLGPQLVLQACNKLFEPDSNLEILDLGCGTGQCGELLQPYLTRIDGVDLSEHMLRIAEAKTLYRKLACMDIEQFMQTTDKQYDLIVGSGVLIFIGDLGPIINLSVKLLRPKGRFVFTTYKCENAEISIRDNIHFAHSEQHIMQSAAKANLTTEFIDEVIHEFDSGQPQAGFIVCLRKN